DFEDEATIAVLTDVRDLFGLSVIEDDLAWFLLNGQISTQRGRQIASDQRRLLWRLRPHALDLVAAFDIRPGHVRAPIALGGEQERQDEAAAYCRAQRASTDAPVSEKLLRDREKRARRETRTSGGSVVASRLPARSRRRCQRSDVRPQVADRAVPPVRRKPRVQQGHPGGELRDALRATV